MPFSTSTSTSSSTTSDDDLSSEDSDFSSDESSEGLSSLDQAWNRYAIKNYAELCQHTQQLLQPRVWAFLFKKYGWLQESQVVSLIQHQYAMWDAMESPVCAQGRPINGFEIERTLIDLLKVGTIRAPQNKFLIFQMCAQASTSWLDELAGGLPTFFEGLDASQRALLAKRCAKTNGKDTLKHIEAFKLSPEHQLADILEIATNCIADPVCAFIDKFNRLGLSTRSRDQLLAIVAIAQRCAERDPSDTAMGFKKFGLDAGQRDHLPHIVDIIKTCAQHDIRSVSANFRNFGLSASRPEHFNAVLEIALLCAQRRGSGFAEYFAGFGFDLKHRDHFQHVSDLAVICAQNDAGDTVEHVQNFGFDPSVDAHQDVVMRIAQCCAKGDPSATAEFFSKFRLKAKNPKHWDVVVAIAKLCADKDGATTTMFFDGFGFDGRNPNHVPHILEIAKRCAQSNGESTAAHLDEFELPDLATKYDVMRLCVLHGHFSDAARLSEMFGRGSALDGTHRLALFLLCKNFCDFYVPDASPWLSALGDSLNRVNNAALKTLAAHLLALFDHQTEAARNPQNAEALLRNAIGLLSACSGASGGGAHQVADNRQWLGQLIDRIVRYQDKQNDPARQKLMQLALYRWMANLFLNFELHKVDAPKAGLLRPAIEAIFALRDRSLRPFLNELVCRSDPQALQSLTGKAPELQLAALMLLALDPEGPMPLPDAAATLLEDGQKMTRLMANGCLLLKLEVFSETERRDLWRRVLRAASARAAADIASEKAAYGGAEAGETHLAAYVARQLQMPGGTENLQKNLYYQVWCRLFKSGEPRASDAAKDPGGLTLPAAQTQAASTSLTKAQLDSIIRALSGLTFEAFKRGLGSPQALKEMLAQAKEDDDALWGLMHANWVDACQHTLRGVIHPGALTDADIQAIQNAVRAQLSTWRDQVLDVGQANRKANHDKQADAAMPAQRIRRLLEELRFLRALFELGGTSALRSLLSDTDSTSLADRLKTQLRGWFEQVPELERFFEVIDAWRNPQAIFIYAGRVAGIPEAMEGLGALIQALGANNFKETRYGPSYADALFRRLPGPWVDKWRGPLFDRPLTAMLPSTDPLEQAADDLSATCYARFQDAIATHGHLGVSGPAFAHSYPLLAGYFGPGGQAKAGLWMQQAASDHSPDGVLRNCFEVALIAFIEHAESPAHLQTAMDALAALKRNVQLTQDLRDWKTMLDKRQQTQTAFNGWRVTVTDDPQQLFQMGVDVPGSCQSYESAQAELCRGLIGTIWDPKVKLVAVTDGTGKIQARSLMRIVADDEQTLALLLEQSYPAVMNPPSLQGILEQAAIAVAQALGCPLATTMEVPNEAMDTMDLVLGTRRYPAYLDSLGGNTAGDPHPHALQVRKLYVHEG